MGNSSVLFRVLLACVRLRLEGQNDLDVALRAKRSAIEQRGACCDTLSVNEESGLNVVKRVGDYCLSFEKLLRVDVDCVSVHFVQPGIDVAFEVLVHLNGGSRCSCALWLADMFLTEEELSVEVAHFNHVWIGHCDETFLSRAKSNHSEVLKQFAADCTRTNHKQLGLLDLFDEVSKATAETQIPINFLRGLLFFFVKLHAVKVELLLDGCELLSDAFHNLLRNNSSNEGAYRCK